MRSHIGRYWGPLIGVSMLASLLLLWITSGGLSIAPDSVGYLSAAENFTQGNGISVSYTVDEPLPLTMFPPFYPWAVGSTALALGTEVKDAARWLNAVSFGVAVLLAGCLIHSSTKSRISALLGSIVLMSSAPLLATHSYAQSDPLFLSLALLGLFLIVKTSETHSRALLICAAAVIGLALLTRYVGIALILTGAGTLAIPLMGDSRRQNARRSLTDIVLFLVVGLLPMMIWTISNRAMAPGMADREFALHFMPVRQTLKLLSTVLGLSQPMVSRHVVPGLPSAVRVVVSVLMVASVLAILLAIVRNRRTASVRSVFLETPPTGVKVLGLFLVCYPAVVIFSILFVDLDTYFDARIVLPIYTCTVILAVSFLHRLHTSGTRSTPWKIGLWILVSTFLVSQSVAGVIWSGRNTAEPRGYASAAWETSPLIAEVGRLPAETTIYSNMPDAILFLTRRSVAWIPSKISYTSGRANPLYRPELEGMRQELETGGVVVIFDQVERDWLAPTSELVDDLGLQLTIETVGGRIFSPGGQETGRKSEPSF